MHCILIVDDSPTALMWQQSLLRLEGFATLVATDGVEAVTIARRARPDLIVLDISMPNMDGFEACRALRSAAETRTTPILLATTHSQASNLLKGLEAGCNDFLPKPLDRTDYLLAIRRNLAWHARDVA